MQGSRDGQTPVPLVIYSDSRTTKRLLALLPRLGGLLTSQGGEAWSGRAKRVRPGKRVLLALASLFFALCDDAFSKLALMYSTIVFQYSLYTFPVKEMGRREGESEGETSTSRFAFKRCFVFKQNNAVASTPPVSFEKGSFLPRSQSGSPLLVFHHPSPPCSNPPLSQFSFLSLLHHCRPSLVL